MDSFTDSRYNDMQRWLQANLPSTPFSIEPAVADASIRRYWRVHQDGQTRIVMDAPVTGFQFAPFLDLHQRLNHAGVAVPELQACDASQGFALLEDLGSTPLSARLDQESARSWYLQAIELLIEMQKKIDPAGLPPYDAAFLQRELQICHEWYFCQQLSVSLEDEAQTTWERSCALIVLRNLSQARCFVHRDYHSRNLMVKEGKLRLIDFQDAVHGPISYDLVSLLRDAYVDWDEAFVLDLAIAYWERARDAGLPVAADFGEFYQAFEWQGLQRHLKVLGIFARLKLRDGKPQYQADIPRVLNYVMRVCERYAELAGLRRLLAAVHNESLATGYTF